MAHICRLFARQISRSAIFLNSSKFAWNHQLISAPVYCPSVFNKRQIQTSSILFSKVSDTEIINRVITVCKDFDKINADALTAESNFIKDLGLDSLDHVEIILSIEDEFGFEIPESAAEKLHTPSDIAKYVIEVLNKKSSV